MKLFFYILLFFLGVNALSSQSLTGTNGLFSIPSATIYKDGTAYLGVSFLPKGSYELYGNGDKFVGMPSFVTLSLYDRIEVMFRYTHQLGQVVSPETNYFPDRMFSFRYSLFQSNGNGPKVTLGLHDVTEALGATSAEPWFLSTYLVISQEIVKGPFLFLPTIGFGRDIFGARTNTMQFNGFFGGLEVGLADAGLPSLILEYDSVHFNTAIKFTLLGHLNLGIGLLNLKEPTGYLTYKFRLIN